VQILPSATKSQTVSATLLSNGHSVLLATLCYAQKPTVAGINVHASRPILISIATGPARLNLILKFKSRPYESSDITSGSTVEL
jgi:hypothetical protein